MKRFFSYIGASLVAIAALSSCSKEIDNPSSEASNGIQFAITASSVNTKTSIDGFKTSWVANDQLNITHAIAGSTTYITDGSFSISEANLATNKFNGTLKSNLEEGSSYDWYALYPYNKGKNYTYIGHSKGATQNGNNSTAHLCGTLCPLYGVAKNVNSSDPVSFDMQHLAAVVEITVTNETDADLTVKNITFASSDENIVGSYIIDFKGDNVTYAASGEQYVSKVATLNVTNGDAIAKNGSAKFYIPIKPHIAEAGSKIVINVNGYEKEIPLTKDVTFKAGTVKKIGFKYDTKSTLYKIEFNNKSGSPSKISTTTKASTFVIAGAEYLETQPFSNSNNAYYGGDTSTGLPLRIGKSDASGSITMALSKNGQINANKIIISAKQYNKGKTFSIGVNGSAKQKPGDNYTDLEFALDGSPLTSIKLDSDGYIYVQSITYLSASVDNTTPSLSVDQTSKVWAADAIDDFVVKVTVNSEGGDWTVTPETLSWANIAVDKAAGTITVTPNGANETETANEAILTVAHASDDSLKKTISLKQDGKGSAASYFVKVTTAPTDWSGKYLIVFGDNAHSYVDVANNGKDLISKNTAPLSIEGDKIVSNETVNADMVEISKTTNGYKILLSDGKYLSIPFSNACSSNTTGSVFTISLGTNGVSISGADKNKNTRTLCRNSKYYRMYTKVGSYELPQLYKLAN